MGVRGVCARIVKDFDLGVFRERYVKRKNEAATKS